MRVRDPPQVVGAGDVAQHPADGPMLPLGLLVPGDTFVDDELFDHCRQGVRDGLGDRFHALTRIILSSLFAVSSAVGDVLNGILPIQLGPHTR